MPYLQDKDLFKEIKQSNMAGVYFLYGQERYFTEQAASQVVAKAVNKSFESFNLKRFEGEKLDFNELEDTMEALPMMADKKCVVVKDLDVEKLSKLELDKLMELIAGISDTTILLIYQLSILVDLKKSSKYKKLLDAVAKKGVVCEFAQKDKLTLKRALCERAKKCYVELDMQTAELLIDRCSPSYGILVNELDKLINFVGTDGEITKKDIDVCCTPSIDSSAFDLAKSILSNNFDRAYTLLDELFFQRQEAVAILSALAMAFGDLYRAKCAMLASRSAEEMGTDFNYPKNRQFAIKNAFRDVKSFSLDHIRVCIQALYDADIQLKSSKLEDRLILEQMLGKMLLKSIDERAI